MFDYNEIRNQVITSIEAEGNASASEYDIDAIIDALRDMDVESIDEVEGYWEIVAANACDPTITLAEATEALDGWDGMVEVSVQQVGDAGIDGNGYDSIEQAVADFNDYVRDYASDPHDCYVITLSKTWPEDPEDEYTSWETEPVITKTV